MSTRPTYAQLREEVLRRYPDGQTPAGISVDDIVQLKIQNTYSTHLDIARSMAGVMRADMAAYDQDHSKFTQSLGCWSGFHAQQMIKSVKRMRGTAKGTYVYLSGWMVAGLRNRFGHQPDQSMHEKTAVADLIEEIYVSLRQADEVALNDLFRELKAARQKGQPQDVIETIIQRIDTFESHVVPIIADIDAGFGNEHATYLLAKEMIKAGACCLQIENQVSDAKQCGHQDGKVTVPREDFIEKLKACRLAFEELGVDDGVIVARTDSLGAGLTQKLPVPKAAGDLAHDYIKWLETEEITPANPLQDGDTAIQLDGKLVKPVRLANGLYKFREGTGADRVVEDCIANLTLGGADLLWIETDTPNVDIIAGMVNRIKEVVPDAKLTYNNSPSFNWTLNLRKQVRADWIAAGRINGEDYPEAELMSARFDETELGQETDARLKRFQYDISDRAGVFHNLITLPTFHMTAFAMDELSKGYFGEDKMAAYVQTIQRREIRGGVSAVKHQHEVGSDLGDTFKEMVAGERALKASGAHNTMNQFENVA
ncbi:MAG: isocitrate lyase [Henriciella sp.]|jgi:isocitrate lyase|uniref:isocitrate lyase n=1 Tax=Henriciella sp. TaxID=1968823 RepID=UPI000C0D41DE|nr:isocitrate lyase [Henriciella sp.]MAN74713.1 isocitrate lyase [Henriciella sp.]MBF32884.1 isocitrate lyase [Hyphomonadaceae bacterium]MBK75617.1 isocitrate lyase [Henriciella sp.]PHR78357.1 MAG: isocitrate lyase [Henriciella sp.]|tara:strand:- start:959 stop:2581 length:1623 start_codon:yes stop_codon:yes gene_type:complete